MNQDKMHLINKIFNNETIFENIKHIDEYVIDFWYARELQKSIRIKIM